MQYQLPKIRLGSSSEVISAHSLLDEHWDEVVKNKKLFEVNPDDESYEFLEKNNKSFTLVCEVDGEIVGYSINIMYPNLHYQHILMCSNDVIFLSKKYRNSPLGIRLIKETERIAKEHGCEVMHWHAKPDTPLAKILARMKNSLHEYIFTKEL